MSLASRFQKSANSLQGTQLEVLRCLHQTNQARHRALIKDVGIGLGTTNFCFKAFAGKGLVTTPNFSQRRNKLQHACLLKPAEAAEKSELEAEFPRLKVAQYQALTREIEETKSRIPQKNFCHAHG